MRSTSTGRAILSVSIQMTAVPQSKKEKSRTNDKDRNHRNAKWDRYTQQDTQK